MSAMEQLDTAERRTEPRLNVGNRVVLVDLGDGRGEVSCCIWDISTRGACLMVPPDVPMPDTFKIFLDDGCRTAHVVWRHWSHIGVRFAG